MGSAASHPLTGLAILHVTWLLQQLCAFKAFAQGRNAARVNHLQGNVARTRHLHGLALGLVRNLVGEHYHGIGVADLVHKIAFVARDELEGMPVLLCRCHVVLFQPVHAAYECYAHTLLHLLTAFAGLVLLRDLFIIETDFQSQ